MTIDESVDVEMYGKPWQGNHKGPPYLGAAVICQIAEDEQDGNINLRHISAGVVMAGFLEEFGIRLANPGDRLVLWLSFYTEAETVEHTITVHLVAPSGMISGQFTHSFRASGGNYSLSIPIQDLVVFEEGVHRFEIGLDGAFVTRVPYQVVLAGSGRA